MSGIHCPKHGCVFQYCEYWDKNKKHCFCECLRADKKFTFKIKASSMSTRYSHGEFSFFTLIPLPKNVCGAASHNEMTIEVNKEGLRKGIQDIFEIGAEYEITIRRMEAPQ